jgi:hypothetical protein
MYDGTASVSLDDSIDKSQSQTRSPFATGYEWLEETLA